MKQAAFATRLAGFCLVVASITFAVLIVGAATEVIRRLPLVGDAWVPLVAPFLGMWPVAVPIGIAGVWSGLDLARHAHDRRPFASIPSRIMALGLAVFTFGGWQGHHDCTTGPPDGLCFLVGTLFSVVALAILLVGTIAVVAQATLLKRGVRAPWEESHGNTRPSA